MIPKHTLKFLPLISLVILFESLTVFLSCMMVFDDLQHYKLALYMTVNSTDLLIAKLIVLIKL